MANDGIWLDEVPQEEGHYWVKFPGQKEKEIVFVSTATDTVIFFNGDDVYTFDEFTEDHQGEVWSEKIEEPC